MKILILTTHLNTGGISSYIRTLSKGIEHCKEHTVFVISSGGDQVREIALHGVRHAHFNIRTKSELSPKIYMSLGKICRFIKEKKIDIIHSQTRITQVLGALAGGITGTPYVSTCHGFFKTRILRRIFPFWGLGVIAISEQVKQHLIKDFKVDKNRVELIHNGIDMNEFVVVDDKIKKKKRIERGLGNNPTIGTIGRLSDVKGQDILICAMKKVIEKIPKARLIIVGQGKMEKKLKDLALSLDMRDSIEFLPIVNQTADMMSLFDVFVMPSIQEGLGLSVLEAQACQLPVVASRVGGIPSLIEDGKTGLLVEPKDVEALSSAILQMMNNPEQAKLMGSQARKFVQEKFSSADMVDKTLDFYQRIINKYK